MDSTSSAIHKKWYATMKNRIHALFFSSPGYSYLFSQYNIVWRHKITTFLFLSLSLSTLVAIATVLDMESSRTRRFSGESNMHPRIMMTAWRIVNDWVVNTLHITVHKCTHRRWPHWSSFVVLVLLAVAFFTTAALASPITAFTSRIALLVESMRIAFKKMFLRRTDYFHESTFVFTSNCNYPHATIIRIWRNLLAATFLLCLMFGSFWLCKTRNARAETVCKGPQRITCLLRLVNNLLNQHSFLLCY